MYELVNKSNRVGHKIGRGKRKLFTSDNINDAPKELLDTFEKKSLVKKKAAKATKEAVSKKQTK